MNKKALVREYAKSQKYFTLGEIVKNTGLVKQVAKNYLHLLKVEGAIFPAGHGIYSSIAKEFIIPEKSRVKKVRQILKKEFPQLDFIIWNTLYFQGYYQHTQTHHITFVEVEKDAIRPVADRISRSYRHVLAEKRGRTFDEGFDITKDPIIIRELNKLSLRDGHNPKLEKMLVDLFIIKDKYRTMTDADYWELWREIYSLYRVNIGEAISYAARRKNLEALISQLIDNIGVNKVTFRPNKRLGAKSN